MSLGDLTTTSVQRALDEFDALGRNAFLEKYGFARSTKYFVIRDGLAYDSKAVCGAAHRWVSAGGRPLKSEEFSGGEKTVVARLTKLGFAVSDAPARLQIAGTSGWPLRAFCELHRLGDRFVITLQSAGGGALPRNPDYPEALEVLLSRLANLSCRLDAVLLDTTETRHLSEGERDLLGGALVMAPTTDTKALAASIRKAAAAVSVDPTKRSGGNSTKQIQLQVTGPALTSADAVRTRIIFGAARVFVLTWNPTMTPIPSEDLERTIAVTESGGREQAFWSTGKRNSGIIPGDHLVLFRQQSERGIVGHGVATSGIWPAEHWVDQTKQANYVSLEWTGWVSTEDRLPVEDLKAIAPHTDWNAILGSGNQLNPDDAAAVLTAWNSIAGDAAPRTGDEGVQGLPEGARKTVTVNRYERNRNARAQCLRHHGTACKVCDIDFGVAYGGVADGFIHVHHIVPIASIGTEYQLNPVTDLVPVCPNCHAMLHHGVKVPRSVDELRAVLKVSK